MASEYPAVSFDTIDDLCQKIFWATKDWDTVWYRGHHDASFKLLPSLMRDPFQLKREGYMAVEFRRRARPHGLDVSNQFNCLCSMQHHGLPTRLLDWTESLAIALYFSIKTPDVKLATPTVWVLNPFELYRLSGGGDIIPIARSEDVVANSDIPFCDDFDLNSKLITKFPIPVLPDFISSRIAAQNGVFTIHGVDNRAIEDIIPRSARSSLIKFIANPQNYASIIMSIELLRPNHHAVFPDVEGIKSHLV